MRALQKLPSDYREIYSVNLQKDKKVALFINGLSILIAVVLIISVNFFIPITMLFNPEKGLADYFIKVLVLACSFAAYIFLHEIIHGITMKAFGTKKIKYGFTGMYAFAGSDDYYDKKSYITIALAPIIVFIFVFTLLTLIVPQDWFWIAYLLLTFNIAGASGDMFVTAKFAKMPKDILVKDCGIGMTVYSKQY